MCIFQALPPLSALFRPSVAPCSLLRSAERGHHHYDRRHVSSVCVLPLFCSSILARTNLPLPVPQYLLVQSPCYPHPGRCPLPCCPYLHGCVCTSLSLSVLPCRWALWCAVTFLVMKFWNATTSQTQPVLGYCLFCTPISYLPTAHSPLPGYWPILCAVPLPQ